MGPMATLDQLLDTQRLDEVTERARKVEFRRTFLTVLAGMLFGVGWLAARVLGGVWLGVVWVAVAVKVGWVEGRKPFRNP